MKPLNRITRRKWQALKWRDPRKDLVDLGRLQGRLRCAKFEDLRHRDLKWAREPLQAALFSYFISCALKNRIEYAMSEEEDYDCVLRRKVDGATGYTPVQLKEIVPSCIDTKASIKTGLEKLKKYRTSDHTVVAFHVNQSGYFDYPSMPKPETSLAEIWFYAPLTSDLFLWELYGDLLHQPRPYEIPWPMP